MPTPDAPLPEAHTLTVDRTARYYVLGRPGPALRSVWFVLHGYGQLAAYFLRPFRPFAAEGRHLFVAPEALSRFYLDAEYARVGASWMTREARHDEIHDTVAYLDALGRRVLEAVDRRRVAVHVLGFSQGAAAACRWAALGALRPARVVLWGSGVPHDLDLAAHAARLRGLTLVVGDADEYVTPERLTAERARLDAAGLAYRVLAYEGEHRLYAEPLAAVLAP